MSWWLRYLIFALALTIAVEAVVALIVATKPDRSRLLRDVFWVNVFTNPLANAMVTEVGAPLLLVEILVVLVEVLVYVTITRVSPKTAWLTACFGNLITFALSFAVN